MTRLRWFASMAIAAAFTLGCGGSPKPVSQMATSEASIRGATEAGAQSVPEAKLYLTMAKEKHERAIALVEDDENDEAVALFIRSAADAELAIALARAARAQAEADEARAGVQNLKETP